jgi:hypothetical protein
MVVINNDWGNDYRTECLQHFDRQQLPTELELTLAQNRYQQEDFMYRRVTVFFWSP